MVAPAKGDEKGMRGEDFMVQQLLQCCDLFIDSIKPSRFTDNRELANLETGKKTSSSNELGFLVLNIPMRCLPNNSFQLITHFTKSTATKHASDPSTTYKRYINRRTRSNSTHAVSPPLFSKEANFRDLKLPFAIGPGQIAVTIAPVRSSPVLLKWFHNPKKFIELGTLKKVSQTF